MSACRVLLPTPTECITSPYSYIVPCFTKKKREEKLLEGCMGLRMISVCVLSVAMGTCSKYKKRGEKNTAQTAFCLCFSRPVEWLDHRHVFFFLMALKTCVTVFQPFLFKHQADLSLCALIFMLFPLAKFSHEHLHGRWWPFRAARLPSIWQMHNIGSVNLLFQQFSAISLPCMLILQCNKNFGYIAQPLVKW